MPPLVARARTWTLPVLLALCVVAFSAGSSSLGFAKDIGGPLRWVLLFALCIAASLGAVSKLRREPLPDGLYRFAPLPAAFVGVALVSAGWSFEPRITFERAISVGVLFLTASALATVGYGDPALQRRLFGGIASGAAVIAAAGLVMLAAGVDAAAQPASSDMPWRFRGFGENPNTIALLAAVTLPIASWLAATGRSPREVRGWAFASLLLLVSVVMTQSRGGLVGAFAGVEVILLLLVSPRSRKLVVSVAVAVAFVGGAALREVTQPSGPAFVSTVRVIPASKLPLLPAAAKPKPRQGPAPSGKPRPAPGGSTNGGSSTSTNTTSTNTTSTNTKPTERAPNVPGLISPKPPVHPPRPVVQPQPLPARADEYGHPALSTESTTAVASGRLAAWEGALRLVRERPLLGYGFGTEDKIFVDRWYSFQGARPENSALGLLLQLGIVGLLLMVAIAAQLAWGAVRVIRGHLDAGERSFAVLGLGVLAAAAVMTVIQSYVYSVGNIAVLPVWVTLFMTATHVLARSRRAVAEDRYALAS